LHRLIAAQRKRHTSTKLHPFSHLSRDCAHNQERQDLGV